MGSKTSIDAKHRQNRLLNLLLSDAFSEVKMFKKCVDRACRAPQSPLVGLRRGEGREKRERHKEIGEGKGMGKRGDGCGPQLRLLGPFLSVIVLIMAETNTGG